MSRRTAQSSDVEVTYSTRSGAKPKEELSALSDVYRFVVDCHAKKKAAGPAPEPDSRDMRGDLDRVSQPVTKS